MLDLRGYRIQGPLISATVAWRATQETIKKHEEFPSGSVVKDMALSVLWLRFNHWTGNFHMTQARQKERKKERKKEREEGKKEERKMRIFLEGDQGWNPSHSSDPRHNSDNARSLTC